MAISTLMVKLGAVGLGTGLVAQAFTRTTDTVAPNGTSGSSSEGTNFPGNYSFTFTNLATGTYDLRIKNAANQTIASGLLEHTNAVGTEYPQDIELSAAQMNRIADHVRRRSQANVEASSDGDTLTLESHYGAIQMQLESDITSTLITVKKTDGVTTLGTKTAVLDANALPIKGVN